VTPLRLAVLGDSIAYGQGASRSDETPAARLAAVLDAAGFPSEPRVFAVPGARSAGLAAQVTRALAWPADVAVVIVGANDLPAFVPSEAAAADLEGALRRMRGAGLEVVVAPAPDLSVVPWVPRQLQATVRAASRALRAAQERVVRATGARLADGDAATSAAFARDRGLFSADRFHPSSAGYAVIARALAPVVEDAARTILPARDAG